MKIAILPGDGIGPEIVAEAVRVLDVLRRGGLAIESDTAPIGGAGYDAAKVPLPEATLALARDADAVLLGAVGGPQVRRAAASRCGRSKASSGSGRRSASSRTCARRFSTPSSRPPRRSRPRWSPGSTS